MATTIHKTKYYEIKGDRFVCCGEVQYRHACKAHDEIMGCQYCEFDPYAPCECEGATPA